MVINFDEMMKEKAKDAIENIPKELKEAFLKKSIQEAYKVVEDKNDNEEITKVSQLLYKMMVLGTIMSESYHEIITHKEASSI